MLSTVFVSEYLCSGGCPLAESEPTLLAEGTAMLEAVLSDLLQIPGIQVRTCVQPGLLTAPEFQQAEQEQRLYIQRVNQPEAEPEYFRQACQQSDLVWVIAPESDDLLLTRTRWAVETGACVLGPDPTTIQLTSDKWQLYQVLQKAGIPTIETALLSEAAELPNRFPCLVKHRWGAGGMGLLRFNQPEEWHNWFAGKQAGTADLIWQPWLEGKSLSAAALIQDARCELLPIGEQTLCWEPRFLYQGGRIPARLEPDARSAILELISQTCDLLPGLAGYVGFDILLPDRAPQAPVLVEINPRLTTAYTGYRRLTPDNLAAWVTGFSAGASNLKWNLEQAVSFQPDGSFQRLA